MSKKHTSFQNGFITVVIAVVLVAIALAAAAWFFMGSKNFLGLSQPSNQGTQQIAQPSGPVIQTDSDLMNASKDLDKTNVDSSIDTSLNQNSTDAKAFGPRIRLKNGTSLNWAGYATETSLTQPQNDAVSDVRGSWTVPAVTCPQGTSNTYSATWLGIDGYSDNSVEQTGTEQDCINGRPSYSAWYEMYPKPSYRVRLPIKAGDVVNAEVHYIGNNHFTLTLNLPSGTFTTTQKSNALRQSAEWIAEAPYSGGVLPLANFGMMNFTNAQATLNGVTGGVNTWNDDPMTMTNSSGTPKAIPSALSPDGSSFSVTWTSN